MKKVFALVLALAMMMMATTAWAAVSPVQIEGSNGTAEATVTVGYTATASTKVTVSWDDVASVQYEWKTGGWTPTTTSADLAFKINNESSSAKKVTIAGDDGNSTKNWVGATAKNGDTIESIAANNDQQSIVYILSYNTINDPAGLTVGEAQTDTLSFTVTIADPTSAT